MSRAVKLVDEETGEVIATELLTLMPRRGTRGAFTMWLDRNRFDEIILSYLLKKGQ